MQTVSLIVSILIYIVITVCALLSTDSLPRALGIVLSTMGIMAIILFVMFYILT